MYRTSGTFHGGRAVGKNYFINNGAIVRGVLDNEGKI